MENSRNGSRHVESLEEYGRIQNRYSLHTKHEDRRFSETSARTVQTKLTEANRISMAEEMAASMVHEISQPLSAMIMNAQAGSVISRLILPISTWPKRQ